MNYSRILLLEYYNFRRKIQFNHPMVCWKLGSARLSVTLSNKLHYPITALLGILHLIVQISLRMWAGVGGGGERSGNGNSARAETESYTVTTWTRFPATTYKGYNAGPLLERLRARELKPAGQKSPMRQAR